MLQKLKLGVLVSLIAGSANASFFPPNNLHLEPVHGTSGMDEARFKEIIDEVVNVYRPIVESHNATLKVNYLWTDNTVNASAEQKGSEWIINMYGGLARRPEVTDDGFAAVVCHELGHHLGGFYFYGDTDWASAEGQADYFATQSCLREVWKLQNARNAEAGDKLSAFGKSGCDNTWQDATQRNLCYRVASSGESLAGLLAALRKSPTPKLETPDPKVVSRSSAAHPEAQCRLDTYFAGSICPVSFDPMIIPARFHPKGQNSAAAEKDVIGSFCHSGLGFLKGNRPLCWFKPNVEFLLIRPNSNVISEVSGNGNNTIEPGETIKISAIVKNETTDRQVSPMNAMIRPLTQGLVAIRNNSDYPGMGPGQQASPNEPFELKVEDTAQCGSMMEYEVTVQSQEGKTAFRDKFKLGTIETLFGGEVSGPVAIPDGDKKGLISEIEIAEDFPISAAKVNLDISHKYTGDLTIDLISPKGVSTRLFSRARGKDLKTELTGEISGSAKGKWKLFIVDYVVQDPGVLNSWKLSFSAPKCN